MINNSELNELNSEIGFDIFIGRFDSYNRIYTLTNDITQEVWSGSISYRHIKGNLYTDGKYRLTIKDDETVFVEIIYDKKTVS